MLDVAAPHVTNKQAMLDIMRHSDITWCHIIVSKILSLPCRRTHFHDTLVKSQLLMKNGKLGICGVVARGVINHARVAKVRVLRTKGVACVLYHVSCSKRHLHGSETCYI